MKNSKNKSAIVLVLIVCLSGLVKTASTQESRTSGWSITPYVWPSDTSVDLTFRDVNIGTGEIKFKDLVDTIDAAFLIQVEGGKGNRRDGRF